VTDCLSNALRVRKEPGGVCRKAGVMTAACKSTTSTVALLSTATTSVGSRLRRVGFECELRSFGVLSCDFCIANRRRPA
jgi:hypothetical protein